MKKFTILLSFFMLLSGVNFAQVLLSEDFEGGSVPADWTILTESTDGGWAVGTNTAASSQYWTVTANGSSRIAYTNDDDCNCDKSADYLVMPALDFSGLTAVLLEADVYFLGGSYQGATEEASIEVSTDGGTNWVIVTTLEGNAGWTSTGIDLSDFAGQSDVLVAFRYNDDNGWVFGFGVDNVNVSVPAALDGEMNRLTTSPFGEIGVPFPIKGIIVNKGASTIESLEITYTVGSDPVVETLTGLNIGTQAQANFQLSNAWIPDATGVFTVPVEITAVNGDVDENADNNSLEFEVEVFEHVTPPNIIDNYVWFDAIDTVLSSTIDQLNSPTDLDFFPILAKNELWVINQRTEGSGGSTTTFYDPGTDAQDSWMRVDGNAWHFMSLPTGIAFGENGNFGSSPGVLDANHSGGSFTGPTLWSSHPDIYAQPSGGNGSHLDMLHGSPFSMGIAHEVDNVYWVFDGQHSELVRYDFVEDHGPGNDYHGDAIVRRYKDFTVARDGDVPSHMVLDKNTGWLYVVDNGNDRVLRLDINSGSVANALPLINEALAEHSSVLGVTWEVIIDSGLDRPCGIEVLDNRLMVSDYATGEIIIYDMDNAFAELGRITTPEPGITGIKVGPEGNIWYTNRIQNSLNKVVPSMISGVEETLIESTVMVYPNPTTGAVVVSIPDLPITESVTLNVSDMTGKVIMTEAGTVNSNELDLSNLSSGIYLISVVGENFLVNKKVVKH